jgi:two-component system KDP operon response regulator KdpE
MSLKVLVVEDDREIRALMQSTLSVEGFDVATAVSLSEAAALLQHDPPDVVVLDLGLPDGDGALLVRQTRARAACRSSSSRRVTRKRRRSSCSMPAPTTI